MGNKAYIVYEFDSWNSISSRRIMSVCSSKENAIRIVLNNHRIDNEEFWEEGIVPNKRSVRREIRKQLEEYNQTQLYTVNYIIEEFYVNRLNN